MLWFRVLCTYSFKVDLKTVPGEMQRDLNPRGCAFQYCGINREVLDLAAHLQGQFSDPL